MTANLNAAFNNQITVLPDFSNLNLIMGFDALWLDQRSPNGTLTSAELANLQSFIGTGRRVVLIGENSAWTAWNNQILGLVGGTFGGEFTSSAEAIVAHELTAAAPSLWAQVSGYAIGGMPLYSPGVASLWGPNQNALVVLDIDIMADGPSGVLANNPQFSLNVARWVAVPEPSIATLLLVAAGGLAILGETPRQATNVRAANVNKEQLASPTTVHNSSIGPYLSYPRCRIVA